MTPRPDTRRDAPLCAVLLALLALAACQPLSGGFDTSDGGPEKTALAALPTVPAPNPFACPRGARP